MNKLVIMLFVSSFAYGKSSLEALPGDNNLPPISSDTTGTIPGDKVIPPVDKTKIDQAIEAANNTWEEEAKKVWEEEAKNVGPAPETKKEAQKELEFKAHLKSEKRTNGTKVLGWPTAKHVDLHNSEPTISITKPTGESVTFFKENLQVEEETITLPSGAHAFGIVKFGEEVANVGESEVVARLDYAFLGPNESVVEMTGCVVWLSLKPNFNSQKVMGNIKDMTCTSPKGRVFTVDMQGPMVGVDSGYSGTESDLIMRGPAKVAALKFLGDITSAYGSATAAVETTTRSILKNEKSETEDKITNVTGQKRAYVEGKVLEANGDFLKYISSFFASMQPTLAIAPGTKIHIVNRNNIKIPKEFFKEGRKS